jgi:uncharacterized protein
MLLTSIQQDVVSSLKSGNHLRVETLRFLISAVRNAGIAKYGAECETKLTDADVLDVVKKQVKSHRESIEAFEKAGRQELATHEKQQLEILEAMLPAELPDEALRKILTEVVSGGETNFGKLMGLAMGKVNGKAGGNRVSQMLKELQSKT